MNKKRVMILVLLLSLCFFSVSCAREQVGEHNEHKGHEQSGRSME